MEKFAYLSVRQVAILKAALFVVCLYPLARLVWLGFTGGLGANPVEFITRSTGTWTLVLLCVTLSVTPLRRLAGWQWLVRLRRMFGLYAFFYASLHFMTYLWLDQFFDLAGIVKDIIKRPFITVGFLAFMLMAALAVTSTSNMVKRLGGRNWQRLHRAVYVIASCGVIHYWWLVKKDITQPLIYALIVGGLLMMRVVFSVSRRNAASDSARSPAYARKAQSLE
ncbi:MAG TPA: protein-methionine-sulfoxide reductase heme-binding subunit MsrQ [Burkholderiales bacterium]|nr:protein-methionine-sulfoxide reductase heme-binding subunit MsrQ [Burkholderiales bacterium]